MRISLSCLRIRLITAYIIVYYGNLVRVLRQKASYITEKGMVCYDVRCSVLTPKGMSVALRCVAMLQ